MASAGGPALASNSLLRPRRSARAGTAAAATPLRALSPTSRHTDAPCRRGSVDLSSLALMTSSSGLSWLCTLGLTIAGPSSCVQCMHLLRSISYADGHHGARPRGGVRGYRATRRLHPRLRHPPPLPARDQPARPPPR